MVKEERKRKLSKKTRLSNGDRWLIGIVFGLMMGMSLWFWWQGSLREQFEKRWESEPVVWEKGKV